MVQIFNSVYKSCLLIIEVVILCNLFDKLQVFEVIRRLELLLKKLIALFWDKLIAVIHGVSFIRKSFSNNKSLWVLLDFLFCELFSKFEKPLGKRPYHHYTVFML